MTPDRPSERKRMTTEKRKSRVRVRPVLAALRSEIRIVDFATAIIEGAGGLNNYERYGQPKQDANLKGSG